VGEILLSDGRVAVSGRGKYIKLPLEKIADFDFEEQEWRVVPSAADPQEVEMMGDRQVIRPPIEGLSCLPNSLSGYAWQVDPVIFK
jgi:hypothetical protein